MPTSGDHNWTWHVATGNRIITRGCLMFSSAQEGFRRLPERLSIDLAAGYMCPVKPAMADGRLVLRNSMLGYRTVGNQAGLWLRYVNGKAQGNFATVPVWLGANRPGTVNYG